MTARMVLQITTSSKMGFRHSQQLAKTRGQLVVNRVLFNWKKNGLQLNFTGLTKISP
jgi:hypothetical protein